MKIRVWKLGSLEHRITASPSMYQKLHDILQQAKPDSDIELIWNAAIDVQVVDPADGVDLVAIKDEKQLDILSEILKERAYQDAKWGGSSHDDTETEENWQKYITEYANAQGSSSDYDFRKRMVKVAALAVAAIEAYDRRV